MGVPQRRQRRLLPSTRRSPPRLTAAATRSMRRSRRWSAAGVLTWVNRIVRERIRERDLFGKWATRWRVIRTSNAYAFPDPNPRAAAADRSTSENPSGTANQGF